MDLWSKHGPILHPTQKIEKKMDSQSEWGSELQSIADLKSDIISSPSLNELQYRSEMNIAVDSVLENDSVLSLYSDFKVTLDTITAPQAIDDFIEPKEKVNSKSAIGFGLSALGVLMGLVAPEYVFHCFLFGVLFSYLGYREIKRHGGKGERLAKWGMGIPFAALALVIVFGLIFLLAYGISLG